MTLNHISGGKVEPKLFLFGYQLLYLVVEVHENLSCLFREKLFILNESHSRKLSCLRFGINNLSNYELFYHLKMMMVKIFRVINFKDDVKVLCVSNSYLGILRL